jgi:hypothetical protein
MTVYKQEIKETIEDRLQKAINLGREEALKEVLKWLEENFYDVHVLHDDRLEGDFESKEQMLQSFKERFNID